MQYNSGGVSASAHGVFGGILNRQWQRMPYYMIKTLILKLGDKVEMRYDNAIETKNGFIVNDRIITFGALANCGYERSAINPYIYQRIPVRVIVIVDGNINQPAYDQQYSAYLYDGKTLTLEPRTVVNAMAPYDGSGDYESFATDIIGKRPIWLRDLKDFIDNESAAFDIEWDNANKIATINVKKHPTNTLIGSDNEEKVWNYLTNTLNSTKTFNLTPIAAAGAMGNIRIESGFDPFKAEAGGGGGWGLIQWTPASTFNNNRPSDTPSSIVAGARSGDNDEYLLWELNALWRRGGDRFWENMNSETSVGSYINPIPPAKSAGATQFNGDYRGQGSAYYFHATIEISGDMDWGLNSNGVPKGSQQYTNSSGKTSWHGNIRLRPYYAEIILNKYS